MCDLNPLVSVLMTSYNREAYIAEAIESVLKSTYENFELIIVDDASSDNTVAIAKAYEAIDNRIKVYVNEQNINQFPNRNKAASYAQGKYVKYLDSDDSIYDWGLEYCVALMEKYPEAGMGIFQAQNKVKEEFLRSLKAVNKHFFENNFLNIGPSGIILKREAFEKAGYYNPNYGVPSDMFFNVKMAALFPVIMLKKEFFFYREHEGQEIKNRDSYLLYNYPFMRDILQLQELPISREGKMKILSTARKNLVKSCLKDMKNTFRIKPSFRAIKLSQLTIPQIIKSLLS